MHRNEKIYGLERRRWARIQNYQKFLGKTDYTTDKRDYQFSLFIFVEKFFFALDPYMFEFIYAWRFREKLVGCCVLLVSMHAVFVLIVWRLIRYECPIVELV